MNDTAILGWYTGKSLANATSALQLLKDSEAKGSWIPGASRKVLAALGKANLAKRFAKDELDHGYQAPKAISVLYYAMYFGDLHGLLKLNYQEALRELPERAAEFYEDFQPIAQLMAQLDATRPAPSFKAGTPSPTVQATLKAMGLSGKLETIRVCPIEWKTIEYLDEKGQRAFKQIGKLLWPKGTVHGKSRYDYSAAENNQCQACGHAIRNAFNWIPLLIDNAEGVPHSMWVGRDCGNTLFGVKMSGELELERE